MPDSISSFQSTVEGNCLMCLGTIKRNIGRVLGNSVLWTSGLRDYLVGQLQVEGGLGRERAKKIVDRFNL